MMDSPNNITDLAPAILSAMKEYKRLQRLDPKHKLLRYVSIINDKTLPGFKITSNKKLEHEFLEKYEGEKPLAVTFDLYGKDLKKIADDLEAKVSVK